MNRHLGLLMLAAACLAGCTEIDPMTSEGAWHPVGANAANLRRMVAVPGDLVQGVAAKTSDGNMAARAMDRLRTDRVRQLPDVGISNIGGRSAAPAPSTGAVE
jgi:type IV pilus biogenesis protein CpaD/CtpE